MYNREYDKLYRIIHYKELKEKHKAYYQINKEKIKEKVRRWRENHQK